MVDSRLTYSRWPAKGDADESHHIHSVASSSGGLGLNPFLLRFLLLGYAFLYLFILLKVQPMSSITHFVACISFSLYLFIDGSISEKGRKEKNRKKEKKKKEDFVTQFIPFPCYIRLFHGVIVIF